MDSYETPTYVRSLQVHNKTSGTDATPLANTMGSCLAILDGEERRKREERATTEDVPDTTIEDLFHEFNSGYKHEGKY